ncbi:MAG: 2-phosphosulfolactate phosphatase [Verrucomicrobia bacterium]|nr:2-phosphosulfolactate phosphatase [Verrucomicrobiota bacterium]
MRHIEVLFTPAEFEALAHRDLSSATCVVFDVLRATTSILTAIQNGADAVIPVSDITEAVAWSKRRPDVLLAGERDGLRITAALSGGTDFDFGNSPREFTPGAVAGRTLVMTTTNGTRALRACLGAAHIIVAGFVNLGPVANWLVRANPGRLFIVCSGTGEAAALEDCLAAGALVAAMPKPGAATCMSDSAHMARELFCAVRGDLPGAVSMARNARRLLGNPELREDVAICLRRDVVGVVAGLDPEGAVRRLVLPAGGDDEPDGGVASTAAL